MVETAQRRMTLAEFLVWDDGTDTRYELVGGVPRAMAPAYPRHGLMIGNAAHAIDLRLDDLGTSRTFIGIGTVVGSPDDPGFYVPDVIVSAEPIVDEPGLRQPQMVVEINSPASGRDAKELKIADYAALPTMQEIWLLQSRRPLMQVWQKRSGQWEGSLPLLAGQSFESRFLGGAVSVDKFYTGIDVSPKPASPEAG